MLDCKLLRPSHHLGVFSITSTSRAARRCFFAVRSPRRFRWHEGKCEPNLRSNKRYAGTQKTTLSPLSLADRAWETDGDESLMLGTQITNKTHTHTDTQADQIHAGTHLSPLPYSSVLSHIQHSVFLCAISDFVVTETDGGIERGMAHQQKGINLPLAFTFVENNMKIHILAFFFLTFIHLRTLCRAFH